MAWNASIYQGWLADASSNEVFESSVVEEDDEVDDDRRIITIVQFEVIGSNPKSR